jgi:hypothetical protein
MFCHCQLVALLHDLTRCSHPLRNSFDFINVIGRFYWYIIQDVSQIDDYAQIMYLERFR